MLFGARADAVGDAVLLQEASEAFDFTLVGCGDEDTGFILGEMFELVEESGDGAVKALCGACGEFDFGGVSAGVLEDVDIVRAIRRRRALAGEVMVNTSAN